MDILDPLRTAFILTETVVVALLVSACVVLPTTTRPAHTTSPWRTRSTIHTFRMRHVVEGWPRLHGTPHEVVHRDEAVLGRTHADCPAGHDDQHPGLGIVRGIRLRLHVFECELNHLG